MQSTRKRIQPVRRQGSQRISASERALAMSKAVWLFKVAKGGGEALALVKGSA